MVTVRELSSVEMARYQASCKAFMQLPKEERDRRRLQDEIALDRQRLQDPLRYYEEKPYYVKTDEDLLRENPEVFRGRNGNLYTRDGHGICHSYPDTLNRLANT